MGKRCIFVFGPESSGTRLWTQILVGAGCDGTGNHDQPFDKVDPIDDLIVWRRSFPYAARWPVIEDLARRLDALGYDQFHALVPTRDWHAMMGSQVRHAHVGNRAAALTHLIRAYPSIFCQLDDCGIPFTVVSFEALVQRPVAYMRETKHLLGLEAPRGIIVYDANAKWYGEE